MPSSVSVKALGLNMVKQIRGLRWRDLQIDPVHQDRDEESEFAVEVRFRGEMIATLWVSVPRPRPFAFRPKGGRAVEWNRTADEVVERLNHLIQAAHFVPGTP